MTAPQEEWTEWFQHDGKGCPCVGQMAMWDIEFPMVVRQVLANSGNSVLSHDGNLAVVIGRPNDGGSWHWENCGYKSPTNGGIYGRVIRYRLKKPRALLDLIQLIADLPAPVAPIKTDGVIA